MKKTLFSLLCLILIINNLLAQGNELITQNFIQSKKAESGEKVFLKLNTEILKTGDSLTYTAFNYHEYERKGSVESKFLSVVLATSSGSPVINQRLKLVDGIAFGKLVITEKIPAGKYVLIAYSDNMAGKDDHYYYKGITVARNEEKNNSDQIVLEAFAEGNQLVKDLNNHLVIKSTLPSGQGLSTSGTLLNSENQKIGEFKTNEEGFCKILFKPESTGKFYLKAENSDRVEIPEVLEGGLSLRLVNFARLDKITFEIESSPDFLMDSLMVFIHDSYYPLVNQLVRLNKNQLSMSVPYEMLGTGLHRLIISQANGKQLLSRYFFIEEQKASMAITGTESTDGDSIIITLNSPEEIGYQFGHFTFPPPNIETPKADLEFISFVKLGSKLKGDEFPLEVFFDPASSNGSESLDLFLASLTNSLIDFKNKEEIKSSPIDSLFTYRILLTDSETGEALFKEKIIAFSDAFPEYKETYVTDKNGTITLSNLYFVGEREFYFHKALNTHQKFEIELIQDPIAQSDYKIPDKLIYPPLPLKQDSVIASTKVEIKKEIELSDFTDLEAFTIESERIRTEQKYRYRPKSMLGLGKRVKILEENINHESPLKLVESYGVQLQPIARGYSAKIRGKTPVIYWDGMILNPHTLINNFSAHAVNEVDVHRSGAIYFYSKSIEESYNNKFTSIILKGFANVNPREGIVFTNFRVNQANPLPYFKIKKGPYQINFQGLSVDGNFYWLSYNLNRTTVLK